VLSQSENPDLGHKAPAGWCTPTSAFKSGDANPAADSPLEVAGATPQNHHEANPAGRNRIHLFMNMTRNFSAFILAASLLGAPVAALGQQTSTDSGAKQDMKNAGTDTKNATKDAANGTKQGTKKAYHSTKRGTKKAYNKTKSTTTGAVDGAKAGAKQPQP
jgi:hypothetical protein